MALDWYWAMDVCEHPLQGCIGMQGRVHVRCVRELPVDTILTELAIRVGICHLIWNPFDRSGLNEAANR